MRCEFSLLGICFNRAPIDDTSFAIFGFSEFLAALALLVLVYNSTDALYRFRIAVAPIPLFQLTFGSIIFIGGGTLLTDLWFAEHWYAPAWGVSRAELQGFFGFLFLPTVLLWTWYAFIRPPKFGPWNYKQFGQALFHSVVRGSDTELPAIAAELTRSAKSLIRCAGLIGSKSDSSEGEKADKRTEISGYANDILLLIANRKFCRHIVSSAPITAIALMKEASEQKKGHLPLGQFARNVTTEAIINMDSSLYHEDDSYSSGLLGYIQPFSQSMYGDYKLMEIMERSSISPIDIDWHLSANMSEEQFKVYCRITLITFKSYVATGHYLGQPYALHRAFEIIQAAGSSLYKMNNSSSDVYNSQQVKRVASAVRFIKDVIMFLSKQEGIRYGKLRKKTDVAPYEQPDIFDMIAKAMFELIFSAAMFKSPPEEAWWVQYNTVWSDLFHFNGNGKVWRVIRFKCARLLFDEIKGMETFPNFKASKILGLCLNVLGLSEPDQKGYRRDERPLTQAVQSWAKRNYLRLVEVNPRVAEDCLSGSISFDAENQRLVKTFARGINLEPPKEYLDLDKPS